MAFRLYVGNYPFNFTKDDVQDLFLDFDGIIVHKICHLEEKSKSFSFLVCKDMEQLVSVIKRMNGISVSGRNLVVRASDPSVQEYVNLILQNEDDSSTETVIVPMQVMKNKHRQQSESKKSNTCNRSPYNNKQFDRNFPKTEDNGKVSKNSTFSPKSGYNNYQQKHNASDNEVPIRSSCFPSKTANKLSEQRELRSNYKSYENNSYSSGSFSNSYQTEKDEHDYFETKSSHYQQALKQTDTKFLKNTSPEPEKCCHPRNYQDQLIAGSNNFPRCSNTNRHIDSENTQNKSPNQEHDKNLLTWVSVTNFRLGTSIGSLYELFSDYKPLKVKMICNFPRKDKALTEAHICFPNKEIAEDVMMNFDNTLFEGRIILVNDVEDLTIMNELLKVSHS